jgi:hypothetical protein
MSQVGIPARIRAGLFGVEIQGGQDIFLFSKTSNGYRFSLPQGMSAAMFLITVCAFMALKGKLLFRFNLRVFTLRSYNRLLYLRTILDPENES